MKKIKLLALSSAVAAAMTGFSTTAVAGASANIGFASQYYFRGIFQAGSSASAGLDYEHESGAYAGTWWADVGAGLETDYYVGYAGETNDISYGVAYIVYDYTDGFDDTYSEIDLTAGYGPVSVEFASGTYDNFAGPSQDYTFTAISAEKGDFSFTYGSFGSDFSGSYFELAYGTEIGGFDAGVSLLSNDKDLDTKAGQQDGETTLIFSLGKGFDL